MAKKNYLKRQMCEKNLTHLFRKAEKDGKKLEKKFNKIQQTLQSFVCILVLSCAYSTNVFKKIWN